MNLILHQFKTDVRHFRWPLVMLWLAFAVEGFLMCANFLPGNKLEILEALVVVWQIFNGVFLIAALVQADALVGTSAAWLTRPLRREHLFWAKSAFMVLLVLSPKIAAQSFGWIERGYSGHLWLCAAGQSLMFSAAVALVVAALASLTRDLARFFLAVAIAAAGMFAWMVVVEMLNRAGLIDKARPERYFQASFEASALTAAIVVLILGVLAGWIAQARLRQWRAGICFFALGLMGAPLLAMGWRGNFLKPRLIQAAPMTLALATPHGGTNGAGGQRISAELVLKGVPPGEVAVVQDVMSSIRYNGDKAARNFSQPGDLIAFQRRLLPMESFQKDNFLRAIQEFFPAQTIWFHDDFFGGWWNALGPDYAQYVKTKFYNHPPPGTLSLTVALDLFSVRKLGEAPLRAATFNTMAGQWVRIEKVKLGEGFVTVSINESAANLLWNRDMKTAWLNRQEYWQRQPYCTYVLYDKSFGEAMLVRAAGNNFRLFPNLDDASHFDFTLRFPYPALRERLLGVTAEEWLREARLCVFAPVYDGSATEKIIQDHYQWVPNNIR